MELEASGSFLFLFLFLSLPRPLSPSLSLSLSLLLALPFFPLLRLCAAVSVHLALFLSGWQPVCLSICVSGFVLVIDSMYLSRSFYLHATFAYMGNLAKIQATKLYPWEP